MVPWKFEAVSVASWATHQYTFGHSVPAASPAMTTEKPVPVRASGPAGPDLENPDPFRGPIECQRTRQRRRCGEAVRHR